LLKLVAWQDRHESTPKKDASDLMIIMSNYLSCGGHERLLSEPWIDDADFDYETAGAQLLGRDIRQLLDDAGTSRVTSLLQREASEERPGLLAVEMTPTDPAAARRLLRSLLNGLEGGRQ